MKIKIIILFLLLFNISFGEISLSCGLASTRLIQTPSDSLDLTLGKSATLPTRSSIFYELDSYGHHLWLENDRVIYGIGIISENYYKERISSYTSLSIYPMYINYLIEIHPGFFIGPGINWAFMELREKNYSLNISQYPGYSLCLRKEFKNSFLELDWLQMKAVASYDGDFNYYHSVNYFLRYGIYLERNYL